MRKFIKITSLVVLAAAIYSFLPVAQLYFTRYEIQNTNGEIAGKLSHNSGDYFEFVVLGDIHAGLISNDSVALKIARHINHEGRFKKVPIDFVAVAGDVTFRGSSWDYRIYNKIRSLIIYPVISAMGNHDDDKGSKAQFEQNVGEREFSFSNRNSYFIVLDNTESSLSAEQFVTLEEKLKSAGDYKHRFIIMHKSPRSLYQQSWYRPELSAWPAPFMALCEKYKVDIVFSGHEHMFKNRVFNGVDYIMSGGGGMITQFPDHDGGYLHYLVVRVYGDYVDYEVRKVFPPLWEFLTYYMWKGIFYFFKDAIF